MSNVNIVARQWRPQSLHTTRTIFSPVECLPQVSALQWRQQEVVLFLQHFTLHVFLLLLESKTWELSSTGEAGISSYLQSCLIKSKPKSRLVTCLWRSEDLVKIIQEFRRHISKTLKNMAIGHRLFGNECCRASTFGPQCQRLFLFCYRNELCWAFVSHWCQPFVLNPKYPKGARFYFFAFIDTKICT